MSSTNFEMVINNYNSAQYQQLSEIADQKEQLMKEESDIVDFEDIVSKEKERRKSIESYTKEHLKDEELARHKAEELMCKIQEERREVQEQVAYLIGEQQAAKKKAAELGNNIHFKIEKKPVIMDVFEHTQYVTSEPHVSEIHVDEHDDKSLGSKIIDGVKNLF